jgi:hypothetical protein
MLRSTSFTGTYANKKETRDKNDRCLVKMTIKHTDRYGGKQTFLDSFAKESGIALTQSFQEPINWSNIKFNIYANIVMNIQFDEMEVEAKLDSISVAHKFVKDEELFEYSLIFVKPTSIDNFDNQFSELYYQMKEENSEGKKVIAEYPVTLTIIEQVAEELPEEDQDEPTDIL